jgi:hypothetical protein
VTLWVGETMAHEKAMDVLTPDAGDWLAIAIAFVAYFLVSFLWWGPLFGKKWAAEMGMDMNERPSMTLPLILQAVGTFLLAYVLWHVMHAFTVVGDHQMSGGLMRGDLDWGPAMLGAFFTWLGFFVPVQLGRIAWEKASWTLFGINAGGHFVGLVVMAIAFVLV